MRVLFLSNYYPPYERGGYEQVCENVARAMQLRGHSVLVLTSAEGDESCGQEGSRSTQPEPEVWRRFRLQPNPKSRLPVSLQFFLTRSFDERHNAACLKQAIRDFRPDVIFIWNLEALPRSLATLAERANQGCVAYWLAGYSPAEPDEYWRFWTSPGRGFLSRMVKRLFGNLALWILRLEGKPIRPRMDHVTVVSEFMRQKGIREGTLPEHTDIIYNGIEVDQFYRKARKRLGSSVVLLQAGAVIEHKGVHVSIEAVNLLVSKFGHRDVRLLIAGSGPHSYLVKLRKMVQDYGIEEQVNFLGKLPRENMPELLARSDILLLSTVGDEPLARITQEAMAGGLLVIGTLTGGTPEILRHGETGLTYDAGDSASLAEQIDYAISNPEACHIMAEKGQNVVLQQFSFERMVDQLEQLLVRATALSEMQAEVDSEDFPTRQ